MADMKKLSAGIVLYRLRPAAGSADVLLVHPGGPYWAKKDLGAWSIPKGEVAAGEDPLAAARRELAEETGMEAAPPFLPLNPVEQGSGKTVQAWAAAGDADPAALASNSFTIEWPPRSGRMQSFPEVDRAAWFSLAQAKEKILPGQRPLVDQLAALLGAGLPGEPPV
jgi:predicted NUDIX family NTP pyrophosphohydrolase